jgi:hypothetical protein
MKDNQDFISDEKMRFGDRIAEYHKKLLEKNPLAISVALIVSMVHLRTLGFVDMFIEGLVCYAISFYIVPAVCNGEWRKTTPENFENWTENSSISLRNSRVEKISIDTKRPCTSQAGRHDMNRNNPSSPLYKSALCKKL